jgi:small subunit ribosomal protein S16
MAVVLRLARGGQKKRPFYRIVVAEKTSRRDGRFIEIIGNYNPMTEPSAVSLREDRVKHWIGVGAQPSDKVRQFIKKMIPDYIEGLDEARISKIQQRRKARKARATARAT